MGFSKLFLLSLLSIALLALSSAASAQEDRPYYVVQEGDSLWQIAERFGVSVEELQQANNISDPGQVSVGARLVIPGLSGVSGELSTMTVQYGETLESLSRHYNISEANLARLNRLISPSEIYAGMLLVIATEQQFSFGHTGRASLSSGQSLLELAVVRDEDPWSLAAENQLSGTWSAFPGSVLQVIGTLQESTPSGVPEAIAKIEVDPVQMVQGGTTVIKVYAPAGMTLRGRLADRTLNFFPQEYGYISLQGIHAMISPGLYPLTLEGKLPDGTPFAFSQNVLIQDAEFPSDPTLEVNPLTVDPTVTEPEKQLWDSLGVPVSQEKMWNGLFSSPVPTDYAACWTSLFGTRRSYNNGPYDSFHSGLDFCGRVGTELYAVAPGKVVYTGNLVVRGGVVVIDHGWGVYTAYDHLSQILVNTGEMLQPGQVIGLGGDTGRTTGPHLHWEVWVSGVQVNPVDWLARSFP